MADPGAWRIPVQRGRPRCRRSVLPLSGNGGFDVAHYDLDLKNQPPAVPTMLVGRLDGRATITLTATQNPDRFNLDLRGLDVSALSVNGQRLREIPPPAAGAPVRGAAYWQVQDDTARSWELTIQPGTGIRKGQRATVVVDYGGPTGRPTDIEDALYGWVTTADGAMVVGEPEGNMTWYPVSDHPTDKATSSFEITVPEGKTAVANGLQSRPAKTRRVDHVVLERARSTGQLPDHRQCRRLQADLRPHEGRAADRQRGRP